MSSWFRDCNLVLSYHEDKVKTNGGYKNNGKGEKIGWSIRDTANDLGKAPATITRMIRLAQGVKKYPWLKNELEMKVADKALDALEGIQRKGKRRGK